MQLYFIRKTTWQLTHLRKAFKEIDKLVSAGRNEVKELKDKDDE